MILIVSLSLQLHHKDSGHDWLESVGLHVCLLQLMTALIATMIGREDILATDYSWGSSQQSL